MRNFCKVNRQIYLYIVIYAITLLLAVFSGDRIYEMIEASWETCAWCFNKFPGEGTQFFEYWLCDEHTPEKIYYGIKDRYPLPQISMKPYKVSEFIALEIHRMLEERQKGYRKEIL